MPTHPASRRPSTPRTLARRGGALVTAAALLFAACSRDDPAQVTAEGPGTSATAPTDDLVTKATGTTGTSATPPGTEPPTTTAAPTSLPAAPVPGAPAPPRPAPAPAPAPAPPPAGRGRVISPLAPPANPLVNIYSQIGPANENPATAGALNRVYVPHEISGTTTVIDPVSLEILDTFTSGPESQHVVPSYDMRTLYVVSGRGNRITPIDPTTGQPGTPFEVDNPYNLYFTPDGSEVIVVAEGLQRLDFRDATTFELHDSIFTGCYGINHIDFSADLTYFLATCEFEGTIIKFDLAQHRIVGEIAIDMSPSGRRPRNGHAQPQDIRLSSDGTVFFVADLQSDGLYLVDGDAFRQVGFIPAGVGTHSVYPSRDGSKMYVINRGTNIVGGPPRGQGSVSVLDPYTREITADWPIPGGGSPDMGNITMDGTQLWLGGRYDREVYVFDLVNGALVARIPVGINPHGLTVWPQPGRFTLGHTGNFR